MQFSGTNILVIIPILIGSLNLLTPFINKNNTIIRSFLLLSISLFFLINVLILDYLFLNGIESTYILINIDKFIIAFHLEALGMVFLNLLAILWIPALLYTIKFLEINHYIHSSRFLFFMNCCILMGSLIALSANLFTLFICYELLTILTIPLIIHVSSEKNTRGLIKYLKILMISSLVLFLPSLLYIYNIAGHVDFIHGGYISGYLDDKYAIALFIIMIFGFAKAALYPLHGWLPAAMVASYPVSALLHAVVVVKAGLFCIFKIMIYVFGLSYLKTLFGDYNWLILIPITSIIYSSIQAIRFTEIKSILAYSTINQLNICLLSAFMLTSKGMIAAIMHMVSHSFTKILFFYAAGNIYSISGAYHIGELINIKKSMSKNSLLMVISGLSLIGIPPLAGFISKFYILMAAFEHDNFLVFITILTSSLFSAIYVIRIIGNIYAGSAKNLIEQNNFSENTLPSMMMISVYLCASAVIAFFFLKQFLNKFLVFI